jgi:hypothetical protein
MAQKPSRVNLRTRAPEGCSTVKRMTVEEMRQHVLALLEKHGICYEW